MSPFSPRRATAPRGRARRQGQAGEADRIARPYCGSPDLSSLCVRASLLSLCVPVVCLVCVRVTLTCLPLYVSYCVCVCSVLRVCLFSVPLCVVALSLFPCGGGGEQRGAQPLRQATRGTNTHKRKNRDAHYNADNATLTNVTEEGKGERAQPNHSPQTTLRPPHKHVSYGATTEMAD